MRIFPAIHLLLAVALLALQAYIAVKTFNMRVLRAYEEVHSSQELHVETLLARSLGEIRFTIAAQLWLLADIYMHKGEEKGISPFEQQDLLYIMRIITYIDPHFVKAYDFAGFVLGRFTSYEGHRHWNDRIFNEAVKFLKEGIRYNPKAYVLYFDLGVLYAQVKRDYQKTLEYMLAAEEYLNADPPKDKLEYGFWANQIYSFLIKAYYELGDYDTAEEYVYKRMKIWKYSKSVCMEWLEKIREARQKAEASNETEK